MKETTNVYTTPSDFANEIWNPAKPPVQEQIICKKCGKDSGWSNSDLAKVKTVEDVRLKCECCGEPVVRVMKPNTVTIVTDMKEVVELSEVVPIIEEVINVVPVDSDTDL